MNTVIKKLNGDDLRSKGRSEEVVQDVLKNPKLIGHLVEAMSAHDPVLRMRAADAAEKISCYNPTLLNPYKKTLIDKVAKIDQQEVRWHVAQILPRLDLTDKQVAQVFHIFLDYLEDKSRIVKTFAMQALADIARQDKSYLPTVYNLIKKLTKTGSPAMQSRGRKLIEQLENKSHCRHGYVVNSFK